MPQDKYNSVFAERLRFLIESHKTTITALSKSLGITRQAVSQYADGTGQPNADRLRKIADFFHVSADYLLGLSDIPTRNETVQGVHDLTGLWQDAIEKLQADNNVGDNEISSFISYLIVNKQLPDLITAVKRRNRFPYAEICVEVDNSCFDVGTRELLKLIITDLFFEIIEDYNPKSGEIMAGYTARICNQVYKR
ncbi:MAG: helix-turn-helix domain-containing protein [Clostridiales bacterium]|nr:helix-turn-helix domain-containing protein [Clostridiales bacterium]